MTPLLLPLAVHGPHGFDGGLSVLPFLGGAVLLMVLLAGLAFSLWRQGRLTLPSFSTRRSPEDEAKRILADGFARGDLSTDEFLERSSVLNWTPGSEAVPARRPRRARR
jgi:putative membrane protein